MPTTPYEAKRRARINYRGSFHDGTVFCDQSDGEPLEVVLGARQLPEALDRAIADMEAGEERSVEAGKAYGEYDENAVQRKVPRFEIPQGDDLEEGMSLMWTSPANRGMPVPIRVVRADEFTVDLDFNHPLAGKDLVYWVKVVEFSE
ncbi:MAG: peptidylprolyl isomerase [Coriobacteriia bacterium]